MGWAGLGDRERELVWVGGEGIMSVVVVHCTPPPPPPPPPLPPVPRIIKIRLLSIRGEQNWWETIIIIMSLPGTLVPTTHHTGWTDIFFLVCQ